MSLFNTSQPSQPELVRSVSYPHKTHGTAIRSRTSPSKPHRHASVFAVTAFVIGIAGFFAFYPAGSDDEQGTANAEQALGTQTSVPEPVKHLDFTAMSSEINAVISEYPAMDIGVSVIDIATGESQNYGVQDPFVAASTAKLLTAMAFLSDVEHGNHTLSEQVGGRPAKSALEAMIVDSDNQAWKDFNNSLLGHAELEAYANKVGFDGYDSDRNTVTPVSLARLLSNFYQHKLLNDEHTKLILSYMERAKEVEHITSIAPAGTHVYHKPGYLTDRIHDAAVIDNGKRPYVLVIFTKSRTTSYDGQAGLDTFQRIARSTFTTFGD